MITETILFILEVIGTIAFAISGALVAIKARFDIFGVIVIGTVTSVGGGIIRDIIIGEIPPTIFFRVHILMIAVVASVLVFILAYFKREKFDEIRGRVEHINNIFDAIGLATFTIIGTEISFATSLFENVFLSITLGVLSGVGGGVLRDILTETPPYIFKKHVYALASIVGACLYYALHWFVNEIWVATLVGMLFIVGVRLLATKYHWDLPRINIEKKED